MGFLGALGTIVALSPVTAANFWWLLKVVGPETAETAVTVHMAMAAATAVMTSLVTAPYGKFSQKKEESIFGRWAIDARIAWMTQEVPTLLGVALAARRALVNRTTMSPALGLFVIHYTHRSLVFPLMIRTSQPTTLAVWSLANVYCCFNGLLQSSAQSRCNTVRSPKLFAAGCALFAVGMSINVWADYKMIAARRKTTPGTYVIPRGGLYEYIVAPNYFGEILEWAGYAVASLAQCERASDVCFTAPLSFLLYTISNLVPRANSTYRWYIDKFGEEFTDLGRKRIVPFIY